MNIYLIGGQDWNRFKRMCMGRNYQQWEEADRIWKKTKSFICTTSYWTVQYAMHVGALDNNTEFEVEEDATKAQIKSIIASVEFIRQKAPKMLSLVQDINFQADGQIK